MGMTDQGGASSPVEYTETALIYHQPDGVDRTVHWDTLRAVLIETSDAGPFVEDVWWVLIDGDGHCIIPQEAGGEDLLTRLQQLSSFDNDAVIAAMASVENKLFLCWQRQ
jgi:hypothetical protein